MATFGHLAAGFALARIAGSPAPRLTVALVTVSAALPDVDFLLDINHRGPTHSIGFATAVGVASFAILRGSRTPRPGVGALLAALAVLSHIGLDLLTAHSPVAALWPLSRAEFVLEDHFVPAAPTDEDLLSLRGFVEAVGELAWAAGLVAVAWLPTWRGRGIR